MDTGGGSFGAYAWSPDSASLILSNQFEWDAQYYIYNLKDKNLHPLVTEADGYFVTSFGTWLDDSWIVFTARASRMHDGTFEYSFGYRSDLFLYDLRDGSYTRITSARDGEFYQAIASKYERIFFTVYAEGQGHSHGEMDLRGHVLWAKEDEAISASYAPDDSMVAFTLRGHANDHCRLAVLTSGGTWVALAEIAAPYAVNGPYWSPDSRHIALSYTAPVLLGHGSFAPVNTTILVTPIE